MAALAHRSARRRSRRTRRVGDAARRPRDPGGHDGCRRRLRDRSRRRGDHPGSRAGERGALRAAARERRLRVRRFHPGALPGQDRRSPHRSHRPHGARFTPAALLRRHDQPLVRVLPAVPRAGFRGSQLRAPLGVADRTGRPRSVLRRRPGRRGARPVRLLPRVLARPGPHRAADARGRDHAAHDRAVDQPADARARVPRRARQLGQRAARALGERHPHRPRRRRQLRRRRRRDDAGEERVHRHGQGVRRRDRGARGAATAPGVERPPARGTRQRARPRGSVLHGAREHLGGPGRIARSRGRPRALHPDVAHARRERRVT